MLGARMLASVATRSWVRRFHVPPDHPVTTSVGRSRRRRAGRRYGPRGRRLWELAVTRTVFRTCPLCEATCGLRIELDAADRVTSVRGDADDVFSAGYLCPKGATLGELEADPDRLTAPRVRRDGQLVEATWEEAFSEVATRLQAVQAEHGPDAVAIYLGNPNVHTLAGQLYVRPLVKALRTTNVYSASSVDQLPKHVSCGYLFGDPLAIPVPDVDRTDLLVVLGGNPRVSNGSLLTAPDLPGRLTALQRRGGRLVVVDPARTRTAERADLHLAIRPGTDALLLFAVVHTLAEEGLVDVGDQLAAHVTGVDDVIALAAPFAPERVAAACGIDAPAIRSLARELAGTERAVVYGRLGTSTVAFGTTTSWLVDVVNVLTGNLDRPGGAMFPLPAHHRAPRRPFRHARRHSRVRGLPEAIGEFPVATLYDEMVTPGDGQVRALITVAGNPALSTPDGARLDAAIAQLDLLIAVDPYVTATSRHADVVLPPPRILQRGHYDLAFSALAVRNVANHSPAAVPLAEGQPDEWEILLTLAAIALGQAPPIDVDAADGFVFHQALEALVADPTARLATRDVGELRSQLTGRRGPERLLDLLLRAGPYGDGFGIDPEGLSLAKLEAHPHGIDLGPLEPRIPGVLTTASGHIELAPEPIVADVARLQRHLDGIGNHRSAGATDGSGTDASGTDGLVLIGRRHLRTNNSWSHNVAGLAKGQQLCTLRIHPDDAAERGLVDGAPAVVRSATGAVSVPIEVTDALRRGVVSLPHGFGHDLDGVEQAVARAAGGANSNVLSDRHLVDPVSGNAVLNGLDVEVVPA
jgi:anaerobic selenocysteine-containing dehydrogenase